MSNLNKKTITKDTNGKLPSGVYQAVKKDGSIYFRISLTFKGKHISLGSSDDLEIAALTYDEARYLLLSDDSVMEFSSYDYIPFDKYICLINFRDNGVYFKNPIYLNKRFFSYFLDPDTEYKFDNDDLFYYSQHKIQRRGGHLFTENYGTQLSLGSRYGIHPFAVEGRDFTFKNSDNTDYRYENIDIINRFLGVEVIKDSYPKRYRATIHVNGYFNLGVFDSEEEAAVAFNKARDLIRRKGIKDKIPANYIPDLNAQQYAEMYESIVLPDRFLASVDL